MNTILKKILVATALLSATSAMANQDISVELTPVQMGAWVEVFEASDPVEGAAVNGKFLTDATGRVFVASNHRQGSSLSLDIEMPNGTNLTKHIFIPHYQD